MANYNFETKNEIWFVFPQKSSGKKSITYNDAVEEALCIGWIDSTIKSLDKEHKIQRSLLETQKVHTRKPTKKRLKWLLENKNHIHSKLEYKIRNVLSDPFIFPNDIIERLEEDKILWKNYQHFSDTYNISELHTYIAARKRPKEF